MKNTERRVYIGGEPLYCTPNSAIDKNTRIIGKVLIFLAKYAIIKKMAQMEGEDAQRQA